MTASSQSVDPFDLVIFGGTGDLAVRKLLPALFHRFLDGQIPASSRIVGIAREALDDAGYRAQLREALVGICDAGQLDVFLQQVFYRPLDARKDEGWDDFAAFIGAQPEHIRVFYLSTSPELFVDICTRLGQYKLNEGASRVVLEKPIGRDLASANQINDAVGKVFSESQIFRIDHYLGKETVQNLLALRFGNALFEPLWNAGHIDHVQITVAETLGVGHRGGYYDQRRRAARHGAEPHAAAAVPGRDGAAGLAGDADAVRDEKLKVLHSLKPIDDAQRRPAHRARPVPRRRGRRRPRAGLPGRARTTAESNTETFVALKAEIANWRWAGVPFYLRTGKRLAERRVGDRDPFKPIPHSIFDAAAGALAPNRLVHPAAARRGREAVPDDQGPGPGRHAPAPRAAGHELRRDLRRAHARRLRAAADGRVRGNPTLFMRRDEVEAAWRWVDPILAAWDASGERAAGLHRRHLGAERGGRADRARRPHLARGQ